MLQKLDLEGCGLLLSTFFCCFRVSDHLLAMSRPSTEIIKNYNIIDQFKRYVQF